MNGMVQLNLFSGFTAIALAVIVAFVVSFIIYLEATKSQKNLVTKKKIMIGLGIANIVLGAVFYTILFFALFWYGGN